MRIFKYEFYKIYSRKIVMFAFIAMLFINFLYIWQNVLGGEGVWDGSTVYVRQKAIEKNKEIASKYEGAMTPEKAQAIVDAYGYPPDNNDSEVSEYIGEMKIMNGSYQTSNTTGIYENFCNVFVKEYLTNWRYEEVSRSENFYLVSPDKNPVYYQERAYFGYTGGWKEYCSDIFAIIVVIANILMIIAVAPVFSEEYSLKTAANLLSTEHGKAKGIGAKMLAAFCFSSLLYTLTVAVNLFMISMLYGTEGLRVSSIFADGVDIFRGVAEAPISIGGYILITYVMGLIGILFHTAMVLAFSAICKQAFSAVILSAACYVTPFVLLEMFLTVIRPTSFVMHLGDLVQGFPFYLPFHAGSFLSSYIPMYWKIIKVSIILLICAVSLIAGYRKYKHHQIEK